MSCNGLCCAAFFLPHTAADIAAGSLENTVDGATIAEMVVPLDSEQAAAERLIAFGMPAEHAAGMVGGAKHGGWFSCSRWDEQTRLCTRYDERPDMCSGYPYAKPCSHGCGFELDDAGKALWKERLG